MTTAYQQALDKVAAGGNLTEASVPSYITSADTLNTANGNASFLDSALSVIEDVPKFVGVSLISGANQLYNIPADIGNLVLDAGIERSDTQQIISELDSDLGAFYQEHQEGADLVGFMVSSLVPGLGGVKILNAGQKSLRAAIGAGKFGENTGKALGLLAPLKKTSLDKALLEVTTNGSAANLLNRNALRAVGAGFGQNALEAVAFETAVAATLFKSPILENQDFGDFMSNVAWGAGVFGFIGGAIDATKINFSLKSLANKSAVEARPWTFIDETASASQTYERVALDFEQLNAIPGVPAGLEPSRAAFLEQAATTKRTTLNNRIRKNIGELSGGNQDVAETLFQTFNKASVTDQQSAFIGLQEVTSHGTTGKLAARAETLGKKVATGKATTKELDEFAESATQVTYAKAWGESAGVVATERPIITQLVDTLKKGEVIKVTPTKVTAGGKQYKFTTHFNTGKKTLLAGANKPWNIMKADTFEANARYIWASKLPPFKATAKAPLAVHVDDIPLMEKVMLELSDTPAMEFVTFKGLAKDEFVGKSVQDFLGKKKVALANRMLAPTAKGVRTQDEIASIVNVKSNFLNGEVVRDSVNEYALKDLLAMQDHSTSYRQALVNKGAGKESLAKFDEAGIWNIPQTLNLTYDTTPFQGVNNFVIENMVIIKEQQKLYQEGTSRAAASVLGDDYHKLEDITSGKVFSGAVPSGAGAGFATAASSNYGTLAASVEGIGAVTSRMIEKAKARSREALEPLLYKLGNNPESAVEWSTLNARVRGIEGEYGLNATGDALEPLVLLRWQQASKEAVEAGTKPPKRPVLANSDMELRIELANQEVRDLAKAHIEVNGARTNGLAGIRTAQGTQFNRAPDAFYPIPIDTKEFPHFAIVTDESITSGNHSKTLYASSTEELDGMIKKLKENPHLRVRTKNEAETYFKSQGQYDYEKTLNNNYLDTEAHRKGVSAPFFVATDPSKITTDMLNWHLQRESGLVREAVTAKYEVQFNELRRLGDEATNIATSKFSNANLVEFAEDAVKNPFADYIKTALNLRKTTDYPWWVQTNQMADKAVSVLLKKVANVVETAKTPAELAKANDMLVAGGYKGAAYDESMLIFANAGPAKGALTAVVQKANSIMATVVLRWDALNAVNNAVSANVLLGAETKAVTRAILRGDAEAVGALSKLMNIKVPGVEANIRAPQKLISNAILKFNRTGADMQWFKDNGYVTSISDQYRSALDSLAYNSKESVKSWDGRVNKLQANLRALGDTGEKWTGNKLAEEFNRFVAADVMKQMTDIAVTRKLMTSKEQLAYINTFVNRTQGNYLAAQRPMMFQGPIGQAIGLFQTYQFNLLQQLLRHVGEGHAKDSMVLLGLQGTIHGMNGLPSFNAINTHLVGNASGNTEHKDAYSALYGAAGKEAGDWLMYGMASNAMGLLHPDLKVNLYTRGDINPRSVTLVPTNPADIPFIHATGRVISNLFNTARNIANGGDVVTSLLQGIEHNGLSRPLAGLAQTMQGAGNPQQASFSTSNRGNVIAANDLVSLTNLSRIVGGKPLDEAVALDAAYRIKAYGLIDSKRRQVLGNAIKSTMIGGQDPDQGQIEGFAEQYAKMGGRQDEFNNWMGQLYKGANLSQANKIQQSLRSPFTQSMQRIMGGKELRDFSDSIPEAN